MNLFKDGFAEPTANFPEKLLQEIIKGFPTATNGLAQLDLIEQTKRGKVNLIGGLNNNFQFKVVLTSSYLKGYSFTVFEFGYDVTIYPAFIEVSEEVGDELPGENWFAAGALEIHIEQNEDSYIISCGNEEAFKAVLVSIFDTDKFTTTVGGLMKIARSKA